MKTARTSSLVLISMLLAAVPALAGTITVDSFTDDGTGCTLREAADSSNAGTNMGGCTATGYPVTEILFARKGTIVLGSPIHIIRSVSIVGPPPAVGSGGAAVMAEWPTKVTIKVKAGVKRALEFGSVESVAGDQVFKVSHITFAGAAAGGGGGGVSLTNDSLTLTNCVIRDCTSAGPGGGIINSSGYLELWSTRVTGNRSDGAGGGIASFGDFLFMENCTVSGNVSLAGRGGGIYVKGNADIYDSTFAGNLTRAGNLTHLGGGGIFLNGEGGSTVNLSSSIVWGNASPLATGPAGIATMWTPTLTVLYSDIQGSASWPGTGNILANPKFIKPQAASLSPTSAGDYHLLRSSPCRKAGVANPFITEDIDGDVRTTDVGPDMGSDEAGPPVNDSFEYGALVPIPWVGSGLTAADGRDTAVRHLGAASFRIVGEGEPKEISQTFNFSGSAGTRVILAGWSKAVNAGILYWLEAVISYDDGHVGRINLAYPAGTHSWKYLEKDLTASGPFNKVSVTAFYSDGAGTVWFDDLKLYIMP